MSARFAALPLRVCLALALLPLGGCTAYFGSRAMRENADQYNAREATLHVHRPDLLQGVRKVIVPDLRVTMPAGATGRDVLYKDSSAEGTGFWADRSFGITFAEFFEEALLKLPGLEVLERNRLRTLLGEQQIQQSGLVGTITAEPARFEGADSILVGTLTMGMLYMPNDPALPSLESVAFHLRLLDIRTGAIILVYRDRQMVVGALPDEEELLERCASRFTQRLQAMRQKKP